MRRSAPAAAADGGLPPANEPIQLVKNTSEDEDSLERQETACTMAAPPHEHTGKIHFRIHIITVAQFAGFYMLPILFHKTFS